MGARLRPRALVAIALALTAGAAAAWWGVSLRTPRETRAVSLYYLDPQAMYVVPVTERLTVSGDVRSRLETVLSMLTDPPKGLRTALPKGSKVEVTKIADGRADVRVLLGDGVMGGGGEQLMAASLVRTAGAQDAIHEVALDLRDAKGAAYQSEHLDLSQPMSPTDPGMENLYLGGTASGLAVTVYYRIPRSDYLVPVRVPLPASEQAEPIKGSFGLLASQPPQELRAVVASPLEPAEWRWNGIDGATARVTWSSTAAPSELALSALVLTLTDSGKVQAVKVEREGGAIAERVGPYDLSRPLERPQGLNPVAGR